MSVFIYEIYYIQSFNTDLKYLNVFVFNIKVGNDD